MSSETSSESGKAPAPSRQQDVLLELNFVPQWARTPSGENPYADKEFPQDRRERRGHRDRDRRGGHGGGRDRRPGQGGQRGGGRPQGDRRGGGGRDGRPGGGGRGERKGGRGDRRGPRRDGPHRPPRERLAVDIRFLPDRIKLGAMVRKMHREQKAYPVMDLASLFIQKPDHYQVKVQARKPDKGEKAAHFFQYVPSKAIFSTRAAAVQYAISRHLPDFFDVEEIEGEAPAGNFVCVCRCTITGTLLGPPNYHGFQTKLQEMVSERFSGMGMEAYRQRVETVRDPELVEQWKAENRVQRRYRLKPAEGEPAAGESTAEPQPAAEPEPPVEDRTDPTDQGEDEPETPVQEAPPAEPEPEAEPEPTPEPVEDTREVLTFDQARDHFQELILPGLIRETNRATMPATVAAQLDDPAIRGAIREAWQRESRFPLSMSLAMRPAFRHMRLHLFKVDRKNMFVTPIPPKPIDPGVAIESIRDELQHLQAHPGCTRQELVQALRPDVPLEDPRVAEVVNNLRWLIDKGHVIEFYDGTLSLPSARSAQRADQAASPGRKRSRRRRKRPAKPAPSENPDQAPEATTSS